MGGLWKLSVCRPKLVSDVQWSAQNGVSSDLGAVEGEAYLTIVLHLTNAATDRSETFPIPSLSASPPDDFQLWVPTALCAKKSGPFFASCFPPITLKPDYSPLINEHFWIIPFPGFADAGIAVKPIQPGDEVDLFIADWEPMPVTAPMAQVTAHWVGPDNSQNIAVPVTE